MFLTAFEDLHRDPQTKKQGENRKELGVEKQLQKLLCTTIIPTRKLSKISVLIHKCGMHNDTVHHKNPKYRKTTIYIEQVYTGFRFDRSKAQI